jgi:hypothetical protein
MGLEALSTECPPRTAVKEAEPLSAAAKARLALEILAAYARVRWLLSRGDLTVTIERLRGGGSSAPGAAPGLDLSQRRRGLKLGNAVIRTLRLLPTDSRCLMRSLVLTSLLARRAIQASVVIGVRPGPAFIAHAWVEHGGEPLLPTGDVCQRLVEL